MTLFLTAHAHTFWTLTWIWPRLLSLVMLMSDTEMLNFINYNKTSSKMLVPRRVHVVNLPDVTFRGFYHSLICNGIMVMSTRPHPVLGKYLMRNWFSTNSDLTHCSSSQQQSLHVRQFQIKQLFYGFSYLDFAESQINVKTTYFLSCHPAMLGCTYACPSDCVLIHSYATLFGKCQVCKGNLWSSRVVIVSMSIARFLAKMNKQRSIYLPHS